ncbi:site-specific integrase [Flavicella sp.]|uniref:site-specific integrase n=1 Tax=Flavicella sp. TaxID=2957742 RepID=UPI003019FA2B
MKTRFVLRKDNNKKVVPVYLHITGGSKRERLNLDLEVDKRLWNDKKQRLKTKNTDNFNYIRDLNLILDNIEAKITNVKTVYRLSDQIISPSILKKELIDGLPRVNFCSYFGHKLKEEKEFLKPGTYRKLVSNLSNLKGYNEEIFFNDLTSSFFTNYKLHLKKKGNLDTTINSNLKSIKKFLRLAIKDGIKIPISIDDIITGSTLGNRTSLKPAEVKKLFEFFNSQFIIPTHKLILGYFLFSSMTGLRFSDVMHIVRSDFDDDFLQFLSQKTQKSQTISLNKRAKEVIENCEDLFVTKYTNEFINRELKKIMKSLGITKKVSFHVARHTFATNYLRVGGRIEKLQMLLGHSTISMTMVYVHIVSAEANEDIHLLDDLF